MDKPCSRASLSFTIGLLRKCKIPPRRYALFWEAACSRRRGGSEHLSGESLLHSSGTHRRGLCVGLYGEYGRHIVSITLVLFAFTTAVAWSYYGDRAITYLFGVKYVTPYRLAYVLGFFWAAVADTSLVWLISAITVALMAIPNLVSIFLLRKEIRLDTSDYGERLLSAEK